MCGIYVMEIFTWPAIYCTKVQPPPAKFVPTSVFKSRTESSLQREDKAKSIQKLYKYIKDLSIFILW
jgi:hypothetical protein